MYLTVDDQGTYVNVYCDGYVLKIGDYLPGIYNNSLVRLAYLNKTTDFNIASTLYRLTYDPDITFTVHVSSSSYVYVSVTGNLCTVGGTPLTNSKSFTEHYHIYSDRFVCKTVWETETGDITLSSKSWPLRIEWAAGNLTNEDSINEDTGSEVTGQTGDMSSATYMGITSDEITNQFIAMHSTGEGDIPVKNMFNIINQMM